MTELRDKVEGSRISSPMHRISFYSAFFVRHVSSIQLQVKLSNDISVCTVGITACNRIFKKQTDRHTTTHKELLCLWLALECYKLLNYSCFVKFGLLTPNDRSLRKNTAVISCHVRTVGPQNVKRITQ